MLLFWRIKQRQSITRHSRHHKKGASGFPSGLSGAFSLRSDSIGKIRLKTGTPQEVRRTLSRVINMVANGEMDSKTGNTIIVGCNAVLSSLRTDEYEKQVEELAELLNEVMNLHEENRQAY